MDLLPWIFVVAVFAIIYCCKSSLALRRRREQSYTYREGHSVSCSSLRAASSVYCAGVVDHNFIQKLINFFKGQRREGYQFAVMVLSPATRVTVENTPFLTRTRESLTDNRSATHPPDGAMGNYIIARPDGHHHAESLLLGRFHRFWSLRTNFDASLLPIRSILLYTWLLPCHGCAKEIIRVLGSYTRQQQVIVVYISTGTMSDVDARAITRRLELAGITMIKECYDWYLPPANSQYHS